MEDVHETIQTLLSSSDPDELRRGLALVRQEVARSGPAAAKPLVEMVASLFYLDPLDRPDLLPVLDEAVSVVAGFGGWVIPALVEQLDAGDLKAQMAAGHALGRIGRDAVQPLMQQFAASGDVGRRCFVLYALGKVKSPEVVRAVPLAVEAAGSPELELRDTAARALGKLCESIPGGQLTGTLRTALLETLHRLLADANVGVRAKAVRSLGKLARHGHLNGQEREQLAAVCRRLAGEDERFDWDTAFVVRREAKEALRFLQGS